MSEDFNSFPSRLTQTALSNISEILKRTRDATNRSAEPIVKQENQKNIERLVSDMRQISVPDMSYLKSGHRDLVIVGNGFDLACGLKSRFSDFIEASEKDDDISIADNAWWLINSHFKIFTGKTYMSSNWADVEQLISDFLKEEHGFSDKQRAGAQRLSFKLQDLERYFNSFTQCRTIRSKQELDVADIIHKWYKYFSQKKNREDTNLAQNFLYSELHDFEKKFSLYLQREIDKDTAGKESAIYIDKAVNLLHQIIVEPGIDSQYVNFSVDILSFNYTTPFANLRCGGEDDVIHAIRNVHGSLANNDIVIGMDAICEDSNNLDNQSIGFTKTYRVLEYTYGVKDNTSRFFEPVSGGLRDNLCYECIKFFGHSLGEQDYSYFQAIFDKVNLYDSPVILKFLYSSSDPNQGRDLFTKVNQLITRYGQTLDNKDHGKNLLHKLLLEDRIQIRQVDY